MRIVDRFLRPLQSFAKEERKKSQSPEYRRFRRNFSLVYFFILTLVLFFFFRTEILQFLKDRVFTLEAKYFSAVAGLSGVLIGVLLSDKYRKRNEARIKKKDLLATYTTFVHDFMAHVKRIEKARTENNSNQLFELDIASYKFISEAQNLSLSAWDIYPSNHWIKAITHRFGMVVKIIADDLFDKKFTSPKIFSMAENWLKIYLVDLIRLLTKGAGIETKYGGFPIFVGWRTVTLEDKLNLKFEVEAPPWKPHVDIILNVMPTAEIENSIREKQLSLINDLRCKTHGTAPHLIINGPSISFFSVCVEACCEEFGEIVYKRLGISNPDLNNWKSERK